MAFTDDAIKAKLASLTETQESISTVSQWIMFYRKHADRTAQVWMQRIKESSSNKKLSLIYLANEIVQQSKIRKKDEFVRAYIPIIVEATTAAYKGSSTEVQGKIRRVVEVWRQRQVFPPEVQQAIEASIDEIDRSKSGRKPALGGSLFSSSSVPPELTSVAPLATSLQKADVTAKPALSAANQEYERLTGASSAVLSPPMHAAGLASLVKKLATAEGAVAETIKARQALVAGLWNLVETNKAKLEVEQAQLADLGARKQAIEGRKREVEEAILKGLSAADQHAISTAPLPGTARGAQDAHAAQRPDIEAQRPDIEALTPPPMESFTPVGSPQLQHVPDDVLPEPVAHPIEPVAIPAPPGASSVLSPPVTAISSQPNTFPGIHVTSNTNRVAPAHDGRNGAHVYQERQIKKRKMSAAEDEMAAFEGDEIGGIDASLEGLI